MKTVINLNILNFFKLKLDNHTVNDFQFNTHIAEREKRHAAEPEDVIDITPYSRVVNNKEVALISSEKMPVVEYRQPEIVMDKAELKNTTYDRRGYTVNSFQSKGIHVDSYV